MKYLRRNRFIWMQEGHPKRFPMRSEALLANFQFSMQPASARAAATSDDDKALRDVARQFEAAFLAEMLKAAKIGETGGEFTGGFGEETFRSFMTREYANALSEQNAFGLAEKVYTELKRKVGGDVE